ncbi:hypothetical protein SCARR_01070 [Pontiella sulfatireligans]|uniref:Uncharacterized protein n=1 Tax=Pontiella sulfatireligans TaxID=2750658 RepID=A0A6C2UIH9_9BACT|nr:hypothetical protein SCARR_01070 [Pontiella sulfatireligans]
MVLFTAKASFNHRISCGDKGHYLLQPMLYMPDSLFSCALPIRSRRKLKQSNIILSIVGIPPAFQIPLHRTISCFPIIRFFRLTLCRPHHSAVLRLVALNSFSVSDRCKGFCNEFHPRAPAFIFRLKNLLYVGECHVSKKPNGDKLCYLLYRICHQTVCLNVNHGKSGLTRRRRRVGINWIWIMFFFLRL